MKVFPRPADPDFVDYELSWNWDTNPPTLGIWRIVRYHTTWGEILSRTSSEKEARFTLRSRFDEPVTRERSEPLRYFSWAFDGEDFVTQILDLWIELDPEGWSDGYAVSENLPRRIL